MTEVIEKGDASSSLYVTSDDFQSINMAFKSGKQLQSYPMKTAYMDHNINLDEYYSRTANK